MFNLFWPFYLFITCFSICAQWISPAVCYIFCYMRQPFIFEDWKIKEEKTCFQHYFNGKAREERLDALCSACPLVWWDIIGRRPPFGPMNWELWGLPAWLPHVEPLSVSLVNHLASSGPPFPGYGVKMDWMTLRSVSVSVLMKKKGISSK